MCCVVPGFGTAMPKLSVQSQTRSGPLHLVRTVQACEVLECCVWGGQVSLAV